MSKETSVAKTEISTAAAEAVRVIAQAANDATKVIAAATVEATKVSNKKTEVENNTSAFAEFIYKQGTLIVAIVGVCFGVYFTFANPTKDNDTVLKLQDARISNQQQTIDGLNLTIQNDTKELKNEVAGLRDEIQVSTIKITELSTIISERIPKPIK